ncbi:hypothetical protein LSTR_LSTR007104 [Laodelphax striatellus]|uniref:Cytochrome P450 n=1 Tax=Laodelphax striatellus TaxID=195883 RepID=A0A482WFN9_LAOST|nr:hypothetical protein LSTR_LSTR007104 [Laodelphax striatellus]
MDHTTCLFEHLLGLTLSTAHAPTSSWLTVLATSAVLLISCWQWRRRRYLQLASKLPGPPTYPIIGNAMMFATRPDEPLQICSELTERYNRNPFKIWIFFEFSVVVMKPDDVEMVLGDTKQFRKSIQYENFRSLMGGGIFTSTHFGQWRHSRKLMTPAFHFTILKGFLGVFFEEASILADKIERDYNGESVNCLPLIGLCTLDTICRTAMGVSVNAQNGGGGDFVRDLETVLQIWQNRMAKVWLSIPFIFALTSMKSVHDVAAKKVLGFTDKVIQKKRLRLKQEKSQTFVESSDDVSDKHCKMAFLDLMLESGMSDIQLRDETMTIIIGGQETTSTELSFALLMLALHPNVQEKVHEELDAVFGEDCRTAPSLFELNSLEYLERVIKETMRLYPALPAIGRRLQENIHVGQYEIPAGVDVGIFIYETHRDPATWGLQPHLFDPDNFLSDKCRQRHPYSYFPFSAGLRNCIGQKYALLQMKSVLSTLLRRFTLSPGPGHRCIEDIEVVMNTTLKSKKGFNVVFELRNNNSVQSCA